MPIKTTGFPEHVWLGKCQLYGSVPIYVVCSSDDNKPAHACCDVQGKQDRKRGREAVWWTILHEHGARFSCGNVLYGAEAGKE